jgi:hypothetical protein
MLKVVLNDRSRSNSTNMILRWQTLNACHWYRQYSRHEPSAQLLVSPIIIGSSTPSLQMDHAHHCCALQALRFALAHHSPTIARPRHTHHNQTGCGSSYGQPTGSDCRLGWACPQPRQTSRRAWRHRVPVDLDRRVDGRSSGSGGMILGWLSHGVTFLAQGYTLISEIVEIEIFRGSEGGSKKGELRTEGLGMLVGVRELANGTRRARIGHQ